MMVTLSVHALAEHLLTATSYQVERGSMFITTRTHERSFTCCTQSSFSSSSRFHFVMLHLCSFSFVVLHLSLFVSLPSDRLWLR